MDRFPLGREQRRPRPTTAVRRGGHGSASDRVGRSADGTAHGRGEVGMARQQRNGKQAGGTGVRPGLTVERVFTRAGENPFDTVEWTRKTSRITNPDGSVVFEM